MLELYLDKINNDIICGYSTVLYRDGCRIYHQYYDGYTVRDIIQKVRVENGLRYKHMDIIRGWKF